MKLIKTEDAVGHILCHDLTQIIPGVIKDALFRKGHIVTKEDIPILLSIGKENLYVWEKVPGMIHEDEAAEILKDISINENMVASSPKEGKIEITALESGLLKVNSKQLLKINSLGKIIIASRHGNFPVKSGDKIAAVRVTPLIIEKELMDKAKKLAENQPIFAIYPFVIKKAAIISTGSELFKGIIKDSFGPVVVDKLKEYNVEIISQVITDDKEENIKNQILLSIEAGAEIVICTGGMSVDPDDRTPGAIKKSGAKIVAYGAPVLPGAMFMLGYYNEKIPVIGLPGCVMYSKRTIFDLILPRLLAGEIIKTKDINSMGEGGLCLSCQSCSFPNCGFGK